MEQKKDWVKDLIVYQVYPRSFQDSNGDGIGDIPGILSRLDHLSALSINALWLSPVFRSPNDDNGYDISGYREIMDEFGTMEDWDALCAECHKRGIKVIMDLVVNHSSDEHPWFLESKTSRDNPKSDYYIWRDPKTARSRTTGPPFSAAARGNLYRSAGSITTICSPKSSPTLTGQTPRCVKKSSP